MARNGHIHRDSSGKIVGCEDYMQALEGERRKILVFQRELPLCLELVTQAIDSCKQQQQQLTGTTTTGDCNLNECNSDQTTSGGVAAAFEEFIPIKKPLSRSMFNEEQPEWKKLRNDCNKDEEQHNSVVDCNSSRKSDWLKTVQLWNQSADPRTKEESPRRVPVVEVKRSGGAFHPFKREEKTDCTAATPAVVLPSFTAEKSSGKKNDDSQKKTRRIWAPELHRRFLDAIKHLGGAHVATPKQIRDLMKFEGLTNDEVKSHLQKYRLHARKPTPETPIAADNNQPPQIAVFLSGIWAVPPPPAPPSYATAHSETASGNEIYAPDATASASSPEEGKRISSPSESPASSSSTQTTTASPSS